jgi:hypothetical protein
MPSKSRRHPAGKQQSNRRNRLFESSLIAQIARTRSRRTAVDDVAPHGYAIDCADARHQENRLILREMGGLQGRRYHGHRITGTRNLYGRHMPWPRAGFRHVFDARRIVGRQGDRAEMLTMGTI